MKLYEYEIEIMRIELERQLHEGDVKIIEWQEPKPRYSWSFWERIKHLLFKSVPLAPTSCTLYRIVWEPTKGEFWNLTFEPVFNNLMRHYYIREYPEIWAAKLKRAREMKRNNGT